MKRICLLFLLLFAFTVAAFPQWKWIFPPVTGVNVLKISTADRTHWVAGCEYGYMLYTPDAGETWLQVESPVQSNITDILFIDNQHAFAAAGLSLLESYDGGIHWEIVYQHDSRPFKWLYYVNGKLISFNPLISNYQKVMGISEDLGRTWSFKYLPTADYGHRLVMFFDENKALSVTESQVVKTTDAWASYRKIPLPYSNMPCYFEIYPRFLFKANDNKIYLSAHFLDTDPIQGEVPKTDLLVSTDEGDTWEILFSGLPRGNYHMLNNHEGYGIYPRWKYEEGDYTLFLTHFDKQQEITHEVKLASKTLTEFTLNQTGVIAFSSDTAVAWAGSRIFRTFDGGQTWQITGDEPREFIKSLEILGPSTAKLLTSGQLKTTTNAGLTWTTDYIFPDSAGFLQSMACSDEQNAFVAIDKIYSTKILRTNDGGQSFTQVYEIATPGSVYIRSFKSPDPQHAYALVEGGHSWNEGLFDLIWTQDGGNQWTTSHLPGDSLHLYYYTDLSFYRPDEGGIGGYNIRYGFNNDLNNGLIYMFHSGGSLLPLHKYWYFNAINKLQLFAYNLGYLGCKLDYAPIYTLERMESGWFTRIAESSKQIDFHFLTWQMGAVLEGYTLKLTTDRGKSWITLGTFPGMERVVMFDPEHILLYSGNGRMILVSPYVTPGWAGGTEENRDSNAFYLYPNPARDHTRLVCKNAGDIQEVIIYTLTGQEIKKFKSVTDGTNPLTIDLSGLKAGIYILKTSGKINSATKLIVQ